MKTEPQILIPLSEYNELKDMYNAWHKHSIYIEYRSYFTGGPGGVTKDGAIILFKDEEKELITIEKLNEDASSCLKYWQENLQKIDEERANFARKQSEESKHKSWW